MDHLLEFLVFHEEFLVLVAARAHAGPPPHALKVCHARLVVHLCMLLCLQQLIVYILQNMFLYSRLHCHAMDLRVG